MDRFLPDREASLIKKEFCRLSGCSVSPRLLPTSDFIFRASPYLERRAGLLAPTSGNSEVRTPPLQSGGCAFTSDVKPGSLIALRRSLRRVCERNQVLEQMADSSDGVRKWGLVGWQPTGG